jgi:hypothetical protein
MTIMMIQSFLKTSKSTNITKIIKRYPHLCDMYLTPLRGVD